MNDDHNDDARPRPAPGEAAFLGRAVDLAVDNAAAGQLPFGALVVRDGEVLATGVNTSLRDHDPTAHAEVEAIRTACRDLHTPALPGATLVSSCEPCALCHAAAATAGIVRVVYAAPKEVAFAALGRRRARTSPCSARCSTPSARSRGTDRARPDRGRRPAVRAVHDVGGAIVIRLGVNVPNFGPGTTPASLRSWVTLAEEAGFSLAMMSDHVAPTPDVTAIYPPPFYDPFTTLAWLATSTTRLSLGTSVAIVPYRHPLLTARASANLDQLTGGRFVLGVGAGWAESEFAALGVPFAAGRITDEFLTVITRAWVEPCLSFEGDHVRFRDVATGPAPAQRPHPRCGWAAWASAPSRRAARFGDAWHPVNPGRDWLQHVALPCLADHAAALGRPVPGSARASRPGSRPRPRRPGPPARCRQPGAGPRRSRVVRRARRRRRGARHQPRPPGRAPARGRRLADAACDRGVRRGPRDLRACGSADDPMTARFLGASAPPWQGASGCRPRSSTRSVTTSVSSRSTGPRPATRSPSRPTPSSPTPSGRRRPAASSSPAPTPRSARATTSSR